MKKINVFLVFCIIGFYAIAIKKAFFIDFKDLKAVLVYIFIPIFVASFFELALFVKDISFKIKVIIGFIFLMACLYMTQIGYIIGHTYDEYMKSIHPSWVQYKIAKKRGKKFDSRTPIEVINELKKNGERVCSTITPSYFWKELEKVYVNNKIILPLGGISLVKTVYCNESGTYTIYESDEHGFNNPLGLYNENSIDILLIGDSMVHGACVNSDENIASFIRKKYPKTLNIGYGDNGPLSELAALSEFGPYLRPKLTIWFYYEGNDIDGLASERKSKLLTSYLAHNFRQKTYQYQTEIDSQLWQIFEKRFKESLLKKESYFSNATFETFKKASKGFFSFQPLRMTLGLLPVFEKEKNYFQHPELTFLKNILFLAQKKVGSWGGKLIFVYLPELRNFTEKDFERSDYKDVLNILYELKIPYIDILEIFKSYSDTASFFPFKVSVHYTPQGYKIVSDNVLNLITKEKLL